MPTHGQGAGGQEAPGQSQRGAGPMLMMPNHGQPNAHGPPSGPNGNGGPNGPGAASENSWNNDVDGGMNGMNGDPGAQMEMVPHEEIVGGYELRSLCMNLLISVGLGLLIGCMGGLFHNVVHLAQVWTRTHLHNMYTDPWNVAAEDNR